MEKLKYGLLIGTIASLIGSVCFFFNVAKTYKVKKETIFFIYITIGIVIDYIIYSR